MPTAHNNKKETNISALPAKCDSPPTSREEPSDTKITASPQAPLNILIAEDNATNQVVFRALLETAGHTLTLVDNGLKAVEAITAANFDVILMDVRMPVMDGPTATAQIRQLPSPKGEIPIIAITADTQADSRRDFRFSGISDFITKPIDINELFAALRQAMPQPSDAGQTK